MFGDYPGNLPRLHLTFSSYGAYRLEMISARSKIWSGLRDYMPTSVSPTMQCGLAIINIYNIIVKRIQYQKDKNI